MVIEMAIQMVTAVETATATAIETGDTRRRRRAATATETDTAIDGDGDAIETTIETAMPRKAEGWQRGRRQ